MKRILIVSPFPPIIGGVSIGAQRLYETLIISGYPAVKLNTHFQNNKYNKSKILKYSRYLLLPLFILTHKRFDVIHFRVSGVFSKLYIASWRFLFSRKTQFIISIHGEVSHLLKSPLGYFALSKFDKIICVKAGDSQNLPAYLRSKTVEISGFIPPVLSNENKYKYPKALTEFLSHDSIKMLINGKIILYPDLFDLYGFKDAIILLEQLRKIGKNVELIIIVFELKDNKKSLEYVSFLKDLIREKNLDEYVCWIENESMELWPLLKKVQIFLRPTKSDGDALSIRESLFLKTPAIVSNAVPRPPNTVVYDLNSSTDLFDKTVSVIDNYKECITNLGNNNVNFADKIIEEYENW